MVKVKKAIIPAAGLGTRFLPATKAQPKEMLPIVDTPTIQYIIEEAVSSGIEDILIVTGRGKRAIEDHFDKAMELEESLAAKGKFEELEKIKQISNLADIHYIRQKEPMGLGHAIWCARKFIGNDPFAVMLGDDIVVSETPCLKQLIDQFEEKNASIIGVQEVEENDISKYGVIDPISKETDGDLYKIRNLVEKPAKEEAPSNLAIMGRYVLTPEILDILENTEPGRGNEIQLTDALQALTEKQDMYGYLFSGRRYDIGDKYGFVQATVEFALMRDDLKDPLKNWLKEIIK
ncbi:UTP--glucose-1-phosphate uridylyltransferase GalU [Mesobacillus selenatarsenatis]|uniref:UTP--glucose-1-phosphate uridylyltransferase n=1 Tax=Mesobacillus selenatarsenatis (strain DSM 18680 / JCM 14380 / FERM P-15431 / SF-1) TaxID=1321606 RepID=A0A0A8WWM6_MESS1|nr:UTP--glucose-1-phosphate uridylyltransferase GalU [Mesobacillus selenatarsenatis]GAM12013.1 UTP--glucose-1-phosphate uridylyltransferase [Mesobacillus selenatarsenatis SF-1]